MFDLPTDDGEKEKSERNRRWCEPVNRKPVMIELSKYAFETLQSLQRAIPDYLIGLEENLSFCSYENRRDKFINSLEKEAAANANHDGKRLDERRHHLIVYSGLTTCWAPLLLGWTTLSAITAILAL
jgi:hypothetical protein